MNMISLLLDSLRGSIHVLDICQVTRHKLQPFIIFTERDSLATSPFFAGSIELIFTPGHDEYCGDAVK